MKYIFYNILILILLGCEKPQKLVEVELPQNIRELENLTVYSLTGQSPDTLELISEIIFENNDEALIEGYLGSFDVDDDGRVYIVGSVPGNVGIYVFEPNGDFLTKFSRHGKGPGEFEAISTIAIQGDRIFALDGRLQKIGVFSVTNFKHIEDLLIKKEEVKKIDSSVNLLRATELLVSEEAVILKMRKNLLDKDKDDRTEHYYRLMANGNLEPGRILEGKRFQFYYSSKNEGFSLPITMPFSRNTFVTVSKDEKYYSLWSDQLLIKQFDSQGNYLKAIYYPLKNENLDMNELEIDEYRSKILKNYEMPETWPVVHTFESDNEGDLWIATITESDSTFQWFELDQNGELLSTLVMPGKRANRETMVKPKIKIKNGYFYQLERDLRANIERIVKYKIIGKKR